MKDKCVLAYSGGLDTSVILKWLVETYDYDVIAFCANVGQGDDELEGIERKALDSGACDVVVRDVREEFVRDFVFPILRAGAVYEGAYLLGTSIARPLLAKEQIMVARQSGATAVAHGATGKGNDQVRFELTYRAFEPTIRIIAPWRDDQWPIKGRQDAIEYAQRHGIPIKATASKPYSQDGNLLHLSYEGGILEDPWASPPEDMFERTVAPTEAPDTPEEVDIEFEKGTPVAVNGQRLGPAALLERLNEMAGRHGVGRVDMVENRYVGMKSRGVYETPGGTVIREAHRAVESITMDREVMRIRDRMLPDYAALVYNGYWYSPEMRVLNTFMDATQENVSGTARVRLFKGNCTILGRKSPVSLYQPQIASFDDDQGAYQQALATGFIELNALRLTVGKMVHGDPL
ncbi:MAG TPA: argininosuccinate synthase [Armatimonadota bacterium]|nr:argininosuccinate synthase [Armatimonadota bacterium]